MKLSPLIKPLDLNYINKNINDQNFPEIKMPKGKMKIFHFNEVLKTEQITERMDKDGYRPATIHELLKWASKRNDIDWVVALGSVWVSSDGYRYVAYLYRGGSGRCLYLCWGYPDGTWGEVCRFAGVSKSLGAGKLGTVSPLDTSKEWSTTNIRNRLLALEEFQKKVESILNI